MLSDLTSRFKGVETTLKNTISLKRTKFTGSILESRVGKNFSEVRLLGLLHSLLLLQDVAGDSGLRSPLERKGCGQSQSRGLCSAPFYLVLGAAKPNQLLCHWVPNLCPATQSRLVVFFDTQHNPTKNTLLKGVSHRKEFAEEFCDAGESGPVTIILW